MQTLKKSLDNTRILNQHNFLIPTGTLGTKPDLENICVHRNHPKFLVALDHSRSL